MLKVMANTAVQARRLRKRYGGTTAVDGLDLDIPHGEIFALLGPNGAGKTTTIEILTGFRTRDGGDLSVLGEDPRGADRSWRARIGVVGDSASDSGELTVREIVRHLSLYYGRPRDPDEIIDKVGLDEKAKAKVRALSRGQRRRLDVALGIIGQPELLFLDEPTTGLDPESRRSFWQIINELAAENTTILLTSHYLEEVEALADRVAIINDGRIVAQGTPAELGGQEDNKAHVSWLTPAGKMSVRTDTPAQTVVDLVREVGGEVPELTVTRPTLEDTYLRLTGGTGKE